ncbi:YidC/Oxa1 family membrane protein insertase [Irregularibacter muris]|uniref:YidC/Oxa1 family membrane protein insertase n=1 Tax=Irregularibacter muris TaxID=1796619 RepID=A0AAE3HHJ1_9FIRM|nr:YidC/Oxa1 family membrane protein insertase [Irregularibacter muris]MCR1899248.1 YidC/Oxa1 family membrane protein insertase [Irregularibacter muris]
MKWGFIRVAILYDLLGKLLYGIYSLFQNYGLSIIAFTVVVKVFLLPLALKQTNSMKQMQTIQPKIQALQQKYKNDKQKLNEKMMELYKEHNYNPAGGCLPLLIQFPILIGLFRVLQNPQTYVFPEGTYQHVAQSFLWLPNLGNPDPYYILPVLAALTTYLSTKMMSTSNSGDQTQKTMNMIMPLMIGWISIRFPSGLALYWVVSNVFQMIQQYVMMRSVVSDKEVSR